MTEKHFEQSGVNIEALRESARLRQNRYRELALKLFPHVCARCGREFEGKKLRELSVHHKDHDHHNNPPDGSNWELLCLYCHDHEHTRDIQPERSKAGPDNHQTRPTLSHSPFAALKDCLKDSDG